MSRAFLHLFLFQCNGIRIHDYVCEHALVKEVCVLFVPLPKCFAVKLLTERNSKVLLLVLIVFSLCNL